ncbi:MAG TPA: sigma-54 dependent transcriptional regulator, partial [Pirellulales bacterium]|nr:sigma-54 dependent transcriptional regulator [Pirellulales bacterium]
LSTTREPVLILGESGTGKERIANAIHGNSPRADRPLIKVNSAALSPTLLESELFGHERGSFTGAVARRIGRFEQAQGGTIFLDEIGDLDIDLQAKLLRVLQTGEFERVGGNETVVADVRVISATNCDLRSLIAEQKFREDLYYRLNVVSIELPPLRERRDDIPLLAEHVVARLANKYGWPQLALSPEAMDWLSAQPWPGNVRELQNVLARAAALARGRLILIDDLKPLWHLPGDAAPAARPIESMSLREILAETERRVIAEALQQASWNRTRAAQSLGISRRQLFDKIRQYDLQPGGPDA